MPTPGYREEDESPEATALFVAKLWNASPYEVLYKWPPWLVEKAFAYRSGEHAAYRALQS